MSRKRDNLLFVFGILLSFAAIGVIISNPLYLEKRIAEINEAISSTKVETTTTSDELASAESKMTTKFTTSSLDIDETTSSTTTSTITKTSTTTENKSTTTTASTVTLPTSSTTKTTITTETEATQLTETATTSEVKLTTEQTTDQSLKLTRSTLASTTEGEVFCTDQHNKSCYYFAVFPSDLSDNYLISGDGEYRRSTNVNYPNNESEYLQEAAFAMFKNKLFIFGGIKNRKKVAVLNKCEFEELPFEIPVDSGPGGAALSIDNDSKLLACFEKDQPSKHCIIIIIDNRVSFDEVEATTYSHYWGRLALWNNQPTTVGGDVDFKKVETYKDGQWTELRDQPVNYFGHSLIGLDDGSLLKLGGIQVYDENEPYDDSPTPEIFQFTRTGFWKQLGDLQRPVSFGSFFYETKISSIYIFPGKGDPDGNKPIERLDLTTITGEIQTDIIGYHHSNHFVPVLLHAAHDFCI